MHTDIELYNDDCLNVLKGMENESIDCVVTDCPYHIVSGGCTQDAIKIGRTKEGGGILQKRKAPHGNFYIGDTKHVALVGMLNDSDPTTYTKQGKLFKHNDIKFSEWLPEIYRVLKPDTHCYIMINPRNLKELWENAEDVGFQFQQLIVWDKGNWVINKWYMNGYDLILMLRKGKAKKINNRGTGNILRVPNILGNRQHPTEKPVELLKILVGNSTNEGDVVLDPFMGAGSCGVACKELSRKFIGIEIDERYYRVAEEKLREDLTNIPDAVQMSIFDFGFNPYQE